MEKAMLSAPAENCHSCWRSESRGVGAPAAKKKAAKTVARPVKETVGEIWGDNTGSLDRVV